MPRKQLSSIADEHILRKHLGLPRITKRTQRKCSWISISWRTTYWETSLDNIAQQQIHVENALDLHRMKRDLTKSWFFSSMAWIDSTHHFENDLQTGHVNPFKCDAAKEETESLRGICSTNSNRSRPRGRITVTVRQDMPNNLARQNTNSLASWFAHLPVPLEATSATHDTSQTIMRKNYRHK